MKIGIRHEGDIGVVALDGRFDYQTRHEFVDAIDTVLQTPATEIRIDMSGVDYLDSSALGMLLQLRDRAKTDGDKAVVLANCGKVRQLLDIACFGKLFRIV